MISAWVDGARGRDAVKVIGLPPPWVAEYVRLVRERHGVAIEAEAGCVVTRDQVWYVDGYNAVAGPRLLARHGAGALDRCADEARAAWELAHPRD